MAKSNKSEKSNVNAASTLATIGDKKAQLAAQMAQLEQEEKELKFKRLKAIEAKVNELTGAFEVATLADVRNLILRVEKGTLFAEDKQTGERAARTFLTAEQKAALIEERKAGVQQSVLAEKYGVSTQTVWNYCKEAGLVVSRGKSEETAAAQS